MDDDRPTERCIYIFSTSGQRWSAERATPANDVRQTGIYERSSDASSSGSGDDTSNESSESVSVRAAREA